MENDVEFFFRRQHPRYRRNRAVWERSRDAYRGGADYLRTALVRHVSEIELEFAERLRRAYYFNYPRKLARLITQCVLSSEPQRENADPALIEDFSRTGLRANEVMRQFSTLLNLYGSAALVVEMPFFEGDVDFDRKKRERLRPAVRAVSPLEIPDWAYGADGELEWLILEEKPLLSRGPYRPPVAVRRRRLFTRNEILLYEREPQTGAVRLIGRSTHNLGRVPVLYRVEPDGFGLDGGHYFEDVVRISDAILNNESEAQMNVVKQMYGLLVISDSFARGARPDSADAASGDKGKFSHVIARSAAIWETPEESGISRYIAPTGAETSTIRAENEALKQELFDVVGMGLVNPVTREARSAESKAWDYHQVKQFLACRADLLEQAELFCWQVMAELDSTVTVPTILYNREFAVSDLAGSVSSLIELRQFPAGNEFQKELGRAALFLLEKIKKIDPQRRRRILQEIDRSGAGNSEEGTR